MTREQRKKQYQSCLDAGMTAKKIAAMTGATESAVRSFCFHNGIVVVKDTSGRCDLALLTERQMADYELMVKNCISPREAYRLVTQPRKKVRMWVTPAEAAEARRKLGLRA